MRGDNYDRLHTELVKLRERLPGVSWLPAALGLRGRAGSEPYCANSVHELSLCTRM